jgi:hypothetical protein
VGTKADRATEHPEIEDTVVSESVQAELNTEVEACEESVLKCALAHIKAGKLSCVLEAHRGPNTMASDHTHTNKTGKPMQSTQAMMASWEQYKNNKNKGETAITCYHELENTDVQGPIKRHTIMIDTGANVTLLRKDKEHGIQGAKDSRIKIEVADKRCILGSIDGTAHMHILRINPDAVNQSIKTTTSTGIVLAHKVTTVQDLSRELFSVDDMFLKGCSILLRAPQYENGIPEIHVPATKSTQAYSIPLRYDYVEGGFWLDYILHDTSDSEHRNAANATELWRQQHNAPAMTGSVPTFDAAQAATMTCELRSCAAVNQVEFVHEESGHACGAEGIQFGQHQEAGITNIRGVKMGLKSAKKQLKAADFHDDHGHLGCVGKCIICALASGCARGITQVVDRYTEVRRAHTWDGDILTWEHRSNSKNKYQIVLRDRMSKAFKFLYIKERDSALDAIKDWLIHERAKPEFQDMGYKLGSLLVLDRAGEWGEESAEWQAFTTEFEFETIWTSPDNKKEASRAERTVGIAEVTQKALLLQQALHHSWWQDCGDAAEFLLNRFPTTRTDKTMPIDGDQARPIEILTDGKHSRRQCDREISYFLAPGTPALVHDTKAKGSQLDSLKSTWKVACGMYREQVRFWSPWTRQYAHSKSYTAFKLQKGISFIDFLGLKGLPKAKREESIQCAFDKKVLIKLPELPMELVEAAKKASASAQPLLAVKHAVDQLESEERGNVRFMIPEVRVEDTPNELGGSVQVIDHQGRKLNADPKTGNLVVSEDQNRKSSQDEKSKPNKTKSRHDMTKSGQAGQESRVSVTDCYVSIERSSTKIRNLWDEAEARAVQSEAHITGTEDRFIRVCKVILKLPHHQHELYRQWLVQNVLMPDGRTIQEDDLPTTRGICMPPDMRLPKPTGQAWRQLLKPAVMRETAIDALNERLVAMAVRGIQEELELTDQRPANGRIKFAKTEGISDHESRVAMSSRAIHWEYAQDRKSACAVRRQKAVAADTIPEPRNTQEALERDPQGWCASIHEEIDPLIKMGVLDEGPGGTGYTKAQLLEEGIDITVRKAVFVGLYHTHKFDKCGDVDRLKTRCALKGHPGNMQRGIHYAETFTPTPKEDTARLLLAIMCLYNLFRMTGDIVKAYCWAPMPPGGLIAIRYPPGLKKFDSNTGEELYMIMRKNLYGHPAAGRSWGKLRDSEIIKHFNQDGWTCTQCKSDPCLFYFVRDSEWALMSVHTDDMDAVGTNNDILEGIFNKVHEIWEIKRTDPELMLGVCRRVTYDRDGKVESVQQTMEAYIRGMADSFREYLPTKTVQTFLPPKTKLSKFERPSEAEIKRNQDKGYNRAVGMVVWAVRHAMIVGKYGVTQLCTVMATPSDAAFEAAMNAIAFMEQRSKKGIKFSASGNRVPVFMTDASNKPDPHDGICHAGFTGHLANGPLMSKSSKLKHCGLSSEHNEYMGLTACLRAVVWLRQLLAEIGRQDMITMPTVVYGDNIQANRLCKEHFVTTGNQHIYMPYHWNREVIEAGMAVIMWVDTLHNVSDIMSKNVAPGVQKTLDPLLSGYGDISKLIQQLEASPRLLTDDNHKLGGISR